jgi:hypothetical protein
MNCETFREYCLINPTYRQPDFLQHQHTCSACANFAEEMMGFEHSLVEAMKITVPDDLTERVLHRQAISNAEQPLSTATHIEGSWPVFNIFKTSQWFQYPIYALAGSLILAIILFFSGLWGKNNVLPQQVMAYLENEPQAFQMTGDVPRDELRAMFQAIGGELKGDIGHVNFCKLLTIQEYSTAHIVLTGTKGPVNVLFIRNSQLSGPQSFKYGELNSLIFSATWGNLAIVGSSEEPLERIANRINNAVTWL